MGPAVFHLEQKAHAVPVVGAIAAPQAQLRIDVGLPLGVGSIDCAPNLHEVVRVDQFRSGLAHGGPVRIRIAPQAAGILADEVDDAVAAKPEAEDHDGAGVEQGPLLRMSDLRQLALVDVGVGACRDDRVPVFILLDDESAGEDPSPAATVIRHAVFHLELWDTLLEELLEAVLHHLGFLRMEALIPFPAVVDPRVRQEVAHTVVDAFEDDLLAGHVCHPDADLGGPDGAGAVIQALPLSLDERQRTLVRFLGQCFLALLAALAERGVQACVPDPKSAPFVP